MSLYVSQGNHPIDQDTRSLISKRYKTITKAVNKAFWNSDSETAHSRYVGSYGRGTAIDTSDLDILIELPLNEYSHFSSLLGNGPSTLLQTVKNAIIATYPNTNVRADGQVVVVTFYNEMKFEVLPAFCFRNGSFLYPNSHMGGNWLSTNPLAEQDAMKQKNDKSNGLLFDTCKHVRYIRDNFFSSYHLSGILIDSFVFMAIGNWHWDQKDGYGQSSGAYEKSLLAYYNSFWSTVRAPGSGNSVSRDNWDNLGKVLNKMVGA